MVGLGGRGDVMRDLFFWGKGGGMGCLRVGVCGGGLGMVGGWVVVGGRVLWFGRGSLLFFLLCLGMSLMSGWISYS